MRSTCLSAAISAFELSKTGFESHGSTSRTFPLGVTILKADWPYQVSCVSMEITKPKAVRRASDAEEKMVMQKSAEIRDIGLRFNDLTVQRFNLAKPFDIRHSSFYLCSAPWTTITRTGTFQKV